MIDVPAGTEIIYRGYLLNEPDADHPDRPEGHVVLEQAETGAIRFIFPLEGRGRQRTFTTRAVFDAFNQVLASLRPVG